MLELACSLQKWGHPSRGCWGKPRNYPKAYKKAPSASVSHLLDNLCCYCWWLFLTFFFFPFIHVRAFYILYNRHPFPWLTTTIKIGSGAPGWLGWLSVPLLVSAQVMISRFASSSPVSGSAESAWHSLPPSLSGSPHSLSLFFLKIIKNLKKKKR